MLKYLWNSLKDFFMNEKAAPAKLRAVLGFFASAATVVVASASDSTGGLNFHMLQEWGWKGWAGRLGLAAVAGGALLLKAGDKNDDAETIAEKLRAAGYEVKAPSTAPPGG